MFRAVRFRGRAVPVGRDEIAADSQLACADFDSALDGIFKLAFEEKAGHQCWLDLAQRLKNR